jgi:hypothetical protein
MRPRWMSEATVLVVLIAAAAAAPSGASASAGFVPSGSSAGVQHRQSVDGRDTARAAETPAQQEAAIALGLLGVASGAVLLATRTRRRIA